MVKKMLKNGWGDGNYVFVRRTRFIKTVEFQEVRRRKYYKETDRHVLVET